MYDPREVKPHQSSLAVVFCFFGCFPSHGSQLCMWAMDLKPASFQGQRVRFEDQDDLR
jgi:hypothetical protein